MQSTFLFDFVPGSSSTLSLSLSLSHSRCACPAACERPPAESDIHISFAFLHHYRYVLSARKGAANAWGGGRGEKRRLVLLLCTKIAFP